MKLDNFTCSNFSRKAEYSSSPDIQKYGKSDIFMIVTDFHLLQSSTMHPLPLMNSSFVLHLYFHKALPKETWMM
jgi:hypothetical protein